MFVVNFCQEARRLEEKAQPLTRNTILEADSFSVILFAYTDKAASSLHECRKDELFYVLKGEVEMQVESELINLKDGEGILIKAGEKHKHQASGTALMIAITKQPHKHKFYESS